jgi:hypothetical protein
MKGNTMNALRSSYRLRAIAGAVALTFLTSCATTTTAQQDAFKGLKTIRVGVEATLKVFNVGYQAGTYSELQRTQVGNLYAKYLAADKIAAEALSATTTTDPGAIIAQVTAIAGDVVNFVTSLKKGTP